jgi:Tol biopolymer transport system component
VLVGMPLFIAVLIAGPVAGSETTEFGYQRPGVTTLVSAGLNGGGANHQTHAPSISADGRYVVFHSRASNLVDAPVHPVDDVYRRDLQTGETELVSLAADGGAANGQSQSPSISADGQVVAFTSMASNLDPADDPSGGNFSAFQIYVRDMSRGESQRISRAPDGGPAGPLGSWAPSVSGDGSRVAFYHATVLGGPAMAPASRWDVYVHDLETGVQERASVAHDGGEANGHSRFPHLNHDGRYLAFASTATDLVLIPELSTSRDTRWHVYIRDLETGETELVSVNSDGVAGNHDTFSSWVDLSADGRYVAFASTAYNLVPEDTNASPEFELGGRPQPIIFGRDVFVRDREAGVTERVSVRSTGEELESRTHPASGPSISADGRYVAFRGVRPQMSGWDIYVHDRHTGATELGSVALDGSPSDGDVSQPQLSADGASVVFVANNSSDLVGVGGWNVVLRRRGANLGPHVLDAAVDGDEIQVTGMAALPGMTLAEAGPSPEVAAAGPTLRRASLVFRPEQGDLLARVQLDHLPHVYPDQSWVERVPENNIVNRFVLSESRALGGTYGLRFTLEDSRYELRAERSIEQSVVSSPLARDRPGNVDAADLKAQFSLHRCDPDCVSVAELAGGYGTAGHEIWIALPLDVLGLGAGSRLTDMAAFVQDYEIPAGAVASGLRLALGAAELPAPRVQLGLASRETSVEEVDFSTIATLTRGHFDAALDASDLPAGEYAVWAKACHGELCGDAVSVPLTLGDTSEDEIKDTILELTVEGQGQGMVLKARLMEFDAPHAPVVGRTIDFYSDSELIGSDTSDEDGVATAAVPPGHRGANRTYEVIFEGDDFYRASSDTRPGRAGGQSEAGAAEQRGRPYGGAVSPR